MHSSFCVHAIARVGAPVLGSGSGATELESVPWRELVAIVSRVPDEGPPRTMEALLHHEAIVESVRRQTPALPVRFGTVFHDAPSVASALAQRHDVLIADLERLGDMVELSVTALWTAPASDETTGARRAEATPNAQRTEGARYLHARAAEFRREEMHRWNARSVAERIDMRLSTHAVEQRLALTPTSRIAVRATYLLHPTHVGAFRVAFDGLRHEQQDLRLLLTGPWPPYSFVSGTETSSAAPPDSRFAEFARMMSDAMQAPRLNGRGAHVDN